MQFYRQLFLNFCICIKTAMKKSKSSIIVKEKQDIKSCSIQDLVLIFVNKPFKSRILLQLIMSANHKGIKLSF